MRAKGKGWRSRKCGIRRAGCGRQSLFSVEWMWKGTYSYRYTLGSVLDRAEQEQ